MALAVKKKPAAAAAPKLATKGAKPAKAAPAVAGAKGAKKGSGPGYKDGDIVLFKGYANADQENPIFEAGDRLVILKKDKDDNGKTLYEAVKEEDKEAYDADPESVNGDQVEPGEIEKAPKPEVDPYAIGEVAVLGRMEEVLAVHGDDPLAAAQAMQDEVSENMFLFGGFVAQLYAGRAFREYGENGAYDDEKDGDKIKHGTGWEKFCRDQLNMNGRDALRHVNIHQKFGAVMLPSGTSWADISRDKKIGYVKLDFAAKVVNNDNIADILEAARTQSVDEFKATIREDYVEAGEGGARTAGPKAKRIKFNFTLFEDQAEGVKYVWEEAKKQLGLDSDDQVFEAILMQWGSANLNTVTFDKARQKKRKVQRDLKKAGVDTSKLVEQDGKLEELLTPADEGGEAEGEAAAE